MSVTGGFFNSLNGDRKYSADQLSSIFDGILTEGVFENFGNCFKVRTDGSKIIIGSGRAWLNSKWLLNDADLALNLPAAHATFPRYDAVIFDMNGDASTRANDIVVVSGSAATNPTKPSMTKQETHKQYPICYIYRAAGQNSISNANIEIMIGKSALPYITAPLKSISVQSHFDKWDSEFNTWFDSIKNVLDSNTATALYNEINNLQKRMTTAEGNISTNASSITAYSNRLGGAEKNISSLQSSVTALNNNLADKAISAFGYRKIKVSNTDDITANSTPLAAGAIYLVYE